MIKNIIKYSFEDKHDWFDLTYRITEHCNHGCRYCNFFNNKKDTHTVCYNEVATFIKNKLKDKKIRLYIYGGEPTTHPRILDIVDLLEPIVDMIGIQTNLYGDISLIKKLVTKKKVFLLPTFHVEREKNFDLFLEKVLLIKYYKKLWELNFLLPLKNFDYNYQIFLKFENVLRDQVVPQPLIGEEEEWMKKDILQRYLKNKKNEMYRHYSDGTTEGISMSEWRRNREDYVTGWKCSAGLDTLYIEWNGDIFQCLSDMYLQGTPIGSVFTDQDYSCNLKTSCPYKHCQFSTHITIEKQ